MNDKDTDGRPTPLRVIVISHAYNGPGRLEPFAELGKRVNLTLVGPSNHPNGALENLASTRQLVHIVGLDAISFGRTQYMLRGVRSVLRNSQPDIVCIEYDPWHLQFVQVLVVLKLIRSDARLIPVVKKNTFRNPSSKFGKMKRLLARWGINRATAIIAASGMTREMYIRELGARESQVHVQPHLAVDVSRFAPAESKPDSPTVRIAFVGKIGSVKGVPDLLSAFKLVQQRCTTTVELRLAGSIVDPTVKSLLASVDSVNYVGPINNEELHGFLSEVDIFVMPAQVLPDHQEHDGRAVLEAMSAGIPCIVSTSGILPELVSRAEGRVFPTGDVSRFADCLEELITDSELRRELGNHARKRAMAQASPSALATQRLALFNKSMEVKDEQSPSRR